MQERCHPNDATAPSGPAGPPCTGSPNWPCTGHCGAPAAVRWSRWRAVRSTTSSPVFHAEREVTAKNRAAKRSQPVHTRRKRHELEPFDDRDVGSAAALAHRLQAVAATGALQLIEHGGEKLCPGCP